MTPSHVLAKYRWFSVGLIVPSDLLGAVVDLLVEMGVVVLWMMPSDLLGAVVDLLVEIGVVVLWMMPSDLLGAVADFLVEIVWQIWAQKQCGATILSSRWGIDIAFCPLLFGRVLPDLWGYWYGRCSITCYCKTPISSAVAAEWHRRSNGS
jgi:hypothetical protein